MRAYDPELAPAVPLLPRLDLADLSEARRLLREGFGFARADVDTSGLDVDDRTVGDPPVGVRVYRPMGRTAPSPGLLYLHGGGLVLGDVESEHAGATAIAKALGVVVVSVEYRLAPEHPFPAGLDDCYAALQWMVAEAAELGVDTARVGVFGQSAGGGLAAALALLARDRGGPALCFQLLGIPELDDRLDTPSMREFVDTPMWDRPNAVLSWQYYLGDAAEVSPYAAPARATDLAGLPPAYVTVAEFDPLRDEGLDYACRMVQAGVPVELHLFPGTFHGSGVVVGADVSKRAGAEMIGALRRGLRV